jgi:GTPase SAR1 family protein
VQDKWFPEINHFCEGVPILLVGLKTDLRKDPNSLAMLQAQGIKPVSPAQGQQVADEIGAAKYVECSAKTKDGVQNVFDTAIREACRKKGWARRAAGATGGGAKKKCVLL